MPATAVPPVRYHALRVRAVIDETDDARSLVFEVPPELAGVFRYRPGQFLTLRLPCASGHLLRCYSMSSAPALDDAPRVTVKRVPGGRGSNWICDRASAGETIEVMAPAGVFTPRSLDQDFLLFAAGSGITPVFSILRAALAAGNGRVFLCYANRDERSVIFREALRELSAAHGDRLQVVHWLDTLQGIPATAQLAAMARPWRHAEAFICGPAPFMDAAAAALDSLGMDPARIHVERFASLPDEGTAAPAAAADTPPAAVEQAELEIWLDGQRHTVPCGGNETLLEAALRAGLQPRYSCQAGMCASCMCRVTAGEVHLRHNEALGQNDLARAWTLSCQAVPLTPRVSVKFPE
ncbi:3-ketosteroid-9-alpha-hydroxylase [Cupriavidus necator]|uniref:3-ketosteroid-9-alpha-hydroxylase n=2 Tax=Cupriavidus necator TaxID=106590 RepID=A0A1U9V0V8_CUPNE|nr:3-ketosteroid-9-alpha-hydroxylase [Cupriavidus necator]